MGQKVNPKATRLQIVNTWPSRWYDKKQYALKFKQDIVIRKFLKKKFKDAGVSKIDIERSGDSLNVIVHSMRPGVIIGRSGAGIEGVQKDLKSNILNKGEYQEISKVNLNLNILEVKNPNLDAQLVLDAAISDIEKRMPYRRVMKQTLNKVQRAGAKGVKIQCKGRLNGVEIARTEKLSWGRVPLSTFRSDIDYSRGAAHTTYGKIGVKVWIYRGDVFNREIIDSSQNNNKGKK